jgi:hypothetical protein
MEGPVGDPHDLLHDVSAADSWYVSMSFSDFKINNLTESYTMIHVAHQIDRTGAILGTSIFFFK